MEAVITHEQERPHGFPFGGRGAETEGGVKLAAAAVEVQRRLLALEWPCQRREPGLEVARVATANPQSRGARGFQRVLREP